MSDGSDQKDPDSKIACKVQYLCITGKDRAEKFKIIPEIIMEFQKHTNKYGGAHTITGTGTQGYPVALLQEYERMHCKPPG